MKQEERLDRIVEILRTQSLLTVQDICDLFQVSRDTARRDLVLLEEQGRITRTRGGAVSPDVRSFGSRQQANEAAKKAIARAASAYVKDGDVIFMDTSTTVASMAEFIADKEMTVITHSLPIARSLASLKHAEVYMLGGRIHKEDHFVSGSMVLNMLDLFRADLALMGTCGIYEGEIVVMDAEDAQIKQRMIARSEQVLLLTDRSKIGLKMPYRVGSLEEVDVLITDLESEGNDWGGIRPRRIQRV